VSWQLASFAIVLGALAGAFWWYERSHPPAKLLAIVAALAALAALGRDAFAAIPDVKPITAIVLVSGLAFGAAPGFAVGALSALASNVLLGEGPWTPWQMLGWGLVGLLGAGLGALFGRRMPVLAIAVVCAVGAELFNLVLDTYTWTNTGAHTLTGFGVVLGAALTFDVTHVAASFAFGLAFGAVLLRMLMRVRSRLHVTWVPLAANGPAAEPAEPPQAQPPGRRSTRPAATAVLLAALIAGLHALPPASPPTARASNSPAVSATAARAVSYLLRSQNGDGGFGAAPGQASSELYSAWAAIGLAAAGRRPGAVARAGHSVLDALRSQAGSLQGAGDLERTLLALRAAGASPASLPGSDPRTRLLSYRESDGSFGHLVNLTAFAILALRAAGVPASSPTPGAAARWLVRQQEADGGFGFASRSPAGGGSSDVDDTGAAVQALVAAHAGAGAVRRAVAYLRHAQNLDGGFPQMPGRASNAQSTAWAIQGFDAAGVSAARVRRAGSASPAAYLQSLQAADGSIRYSRTSAQTPVWVTAQVLPALLGKPLPVAPPRAAPLHSSAAGAGPAQVGTRAPGRTAQKAPAAASRSAAETRAAARAVGALVALMLSPVAGPKPAQR
jgi:energy-coupling factor transport system substrate-specific component